MEQAIVNIIAYGMSYVEIYMYFKVMSIKYSKTNKCMDNIGWILYGIMAIIINLPNLIDLSTGGTIIIRVFTLIVIGHCVFRDNIIMESIYTICYFLAVCVIDLIVVSFFMNEINSMVSVEQGINFKIKLGIISKTILVIIAHFIVSRKNDIVKFKVPKIERVMGLATFVSFVSIYALGVAFINLEQTQIRGSYIWVCIVAVGVLLNSLIIYHMAEKLSESYVKEKEYEMVECQNRLLTKSTLEKDEMNKEIRKTWHDFNNHMSCIDMLLQMNSIDKAREYIKNMNASCKITRMEVTTGNDMVDIVVNQKLKKAKDSDINIEINAELNNDIYISQMDICAVLCNSLDNAIEACLRIEDTSKRNIVINLMILETHISIDVINTMKEEKIKGNSLATIKDDKQKHGIGMMSMQTIVKKYDGNLDWSTKDNKFTLKIDLVNKLI